MWERFLIRAAGSGWRKPLPRSTEERAHIPRAIRGHTQAQTQRSSLRGDQPQSGIECAGRSRWGFSLERVRDPKRMILRDRRKGRTYSIIMAQFANERSGATERTRTNRGTGHDVLFAGAAPGSSKGAKQNAPDSFESRAYVDQPSPELFTTTLRSGSRCENSSNGYCGNGESSLDSAERWSTPSPSLIPDALSFEVPIRGDSSSVPLIAWVRSVRSLSLIHI